MMLCVLSLTQVAVEAVTVKKVDQHALPVPEEVVHAVVVAAHPLHRVQLSLSLPVNDDDMRDRLLVTGEQE